MVFGERGDGALEARDDGLEFALLLGLDTLDGLRDLLGARGRAAQAACEEGCRRAQHALRLAEGAADGRLQRLNRGLAADDTDGLPDGVEDLWNEEYAGLVALA